MTMLRRYTIDCAAVQSEVYNCEIKLAMAALRRSLLSAKFWRETTRVPRRPIVPITREHRESLGTRYQARVVSHAISDLAGRYANCIPSFGGFEKIRVYVGAAAFSRGVCIRRGLAHVRKTDTSDQNG